MNTFQAADLFESIISGDFQDRLEEMGLDMPDPEQFAEFIRTNGKSHAHDKVGSTQIIAILKVVCEVASITCPIINSQ